MLEIKPYLSHPMCRDDLDFMDGANGQSISTQDHDAPSLGHPGGDKKTTTISTKKH